MTSKALTVLAECVDVRSGRRFAPGEQFDPAPSRSQAKRLVAAGCLPQDAMDAATDDPLPTAPEAAPLVPSTSVEIEEANKDGLFDLTKDELADIVLNERVPIDEDAIKAVVVASIRRHRENGVNGSAEAAASAAASKPETKEEPSKAANAGGDPAAEAGEAPQPLPENLQMRTEEGERQARDADAAAREEHAQDAAKETVDQPKGRGRGAK